LRQEQYYLKSLPIRSRDQLTFRLLSFKKPSRLIPFLRDPERKVKRVGCRTQDKAFLDR
jgi:hypothetical protein